MASSTYNIFKTEIMKGTYDLVDDTVKCALYLNTYTPSLASTTYASTTPGTYEVANGNGYTTGGATMGAKTVTTISNEGVFNAEDTQWTAATFVSRYAVIYDTTASNNLVCWIDFGSDVTVTAGTLTIQWDSDGIINIG